jgi:hypothetical protein
MFETANNAIDGFSNMGGNGGGLLGGLMAVQMMSGMAGGMGGVGSGMMQPAYDQPAMGGTGNTNAANGISGSEPTSTRDIYCGACSKKYKMGQHFCPHCGHKYNPCPRCGTDNSDTAKRCVSCGTPLASTTGATPIGVTYCTRCGAELQPRDKFCPGCGQRRL